MTRKDYEQEAEQLKERISKTRTIPGTQKLHSFVPLSHQLVSVRTFSSASLDRHEFVTIDASTTLAISALSGYVTDSFWWIACIKDSSPEKHEITVSFLHPHAPSPSYSFPDPVDLFTIDSQDVLTTVNPVTATGRSYTISRKETTDVKAPITKLLEMLATKTSSVAAVVSEMSAFELSGFR